VLAPLFEQAEKLISRRADPDVLSILRAAAGTHIDTKTYAYYAQQDGLRERRLAFARAWPSFASLAIGCRHRVSLRCPKPSLILRMP
jgi:predicted protein tyrosine phosphatase